MGTFCGSGPIRKTMREAFQSWMPPGERVQRTSGRQIEVPAVVSRPPRAPPTMSAAEFRAVRPQARATEASRGD
jgi:hypothetical protein